MKYKTKNLNLELVITNKGFTLWDMNGRQWLIDASLLKEGESFHIAFQKNQRYRKRTKLKALDSGEYKIIDKPKKGIK